MELIDEGLPSQPYHHETLEMAADAGEALIRTVTSSANARAQQALHEVIASHSNHFRCSAIAIRIAPLPVLPENLSDVHADPKVLFAADGMIYHRALVQSAQLLGLPVHYFKRDTVVASAARFVWLFGSPPPLRDPGGHAPEPDRLIPGSQWPDFGQPGRSVRVSLEADDAVRPTNA